MATPASTVDDLLANSSEELREMFCEFCKKHGEDATADGFCVNCQEYLCTTCLKYHRRILGLHVLQDKDSMPQDFCFEKCSNHQNEMIKFYCQTCDAFLCSNCAENNHKDCNEIKHMPTIVKDLENGKEFQSVAQQLPDLRQKILLSNEMTKSNYEYIEHLRDRCMFAIQQHRENINTKLDMLEVKLDNEIERIRVNDETNNKSITTKNASLNSDLEKLQSDIDNASGDKCKLFMAMKKVQKEMQPIETELHRLMMENKVTEYIFEPDGRITVTLDSVDRLGSLIQLDSKTKRTATYVSDIDVKSVEDKEVCNITGICSLSKRVLVIADSSNESVKLVDTVTNTIKSVLHLDAQPWDITKMSAQEVAVTLIGRSMIQFITVAGEMSLCKYKTINVGGDCRGIEQSHSNLIVSLLKPAQVQILDTKGTVLQSFSKDSCGKNLSRWPLYLAVSPDKSLRYVTDIDLNSVVSLSVKGNDTAIYKGLQQPLGIATDRTGAVYICERETNQIHHMSSDMDTDKILIGKTENPLKPFRCNVDAETNTIYIGLDKCNVVKQFTIEIKP